MDRLVIPFSHRLVGGALVLSVVASVGCRSTKSEVPPGRSYARTAAQPPTVGFSSEPHPAVASGAPGSYNLGPGGSIDDPLAAQQQRKQIFGTPTTGEKLARPTENDYGPPGTSGLDPTAGPSPGVLANELLDTGESTAKSLTRDLKVSPASGEE